MELSVEEKAFYDALLKPAAIKDFFSNDALVQIAKELTQMLSKSRTVSWQKKETAPRAKIRHPRLVGGALKTGQMGNSDRRRN